MASYFSITKIFLPDLKEGIKTTAVYLCPQAQVHVWTQEPQELSSHELGAQRSSQGGWLFLGLQTPPEQQ